MAYFRATDVASSVAEMVDTFDLNWAYAHPHLTDRGDVTVKKAVAGPGVHVGGVQRHEGATA